MSESDGRGHPAQSTSPGPADWPPGVRPISLDGLDRLGVGDDGTLYWDKKQVVVAKKITLNRLQTAGAVIVAIATVAAAIGTCVSAYVDLLSLYK